MIFECHTQAHPLRAVSALSCRFPWKSYLRYIGGTNLKMGMCPFSTPQYSGCHGNIEMPQESFFNCNGLRLVRYPLLYWRITSYRNANEYGERAWTKFSRPYNGLLEYLSAMLSPSHPIYAWGSARSEPTDTGTQDHLIHRRWWSPTLPYAHII